MPDLLVVELAINAGTGDLLWQKRRALPSKLALCCGPNNRGLAVFGKSVYRGTLDAHLIARDASSGSLLWDVEVGSPDDGLSITAAPLAVKDMIITGVAGGEFAIKGYLDAYDSETGERIWRLATIPDRGDPGHETWSGESWRTGGAPTWMTGSYDPELNLLYWGRLRVCFFSRQLVNPLNIQMPNRRPVDLVGIGIPLSIK